ncbi:MAG: M28 family peptidase [Bacteroidota bacterium]
MLGTWIGVYCQADSSLVAAARGEIAFLCSKELGGRGYIGQGHEKAAHYIAGKFEESGLEQLPLVASEWDSDSLSFLQNFSFPLNLISDAHLSIDGEDQQLGLDFIPYRISSAQSLKGPISNLAFGLEEVSPDRIRDHILLIREGWPPEVSNNDSLKAVYADKKRVWDRLGSYFAYRPSAVLIGRKKLTTGFSSQMIPLPVLEFQLDSMPELADSAEISVSSELKEIQGINVMGMLAGTRFPDTAIIVSAHYDHLGEIGGIRFPGANDNASGLALMFSLIEHFGIQANRPTYSLVFIAFGGEETGLRGSKYYVEENPLFPLSQTKFILNLDLMGNGEKGIMAVGGRDFPQYFDQLVRINDSLQLVSKVNARPNAPNSDHYFFLKNGIPGFFIYTMGGPPHYHDVRDTPENLLLSHFLELRKLFIIFLQSL